MDAKLEKERQDMMKYATMHMTEDRFIELFNKAIKCTEELLTQAGLDKESVLQDLLGYRSKYNTSIAFDIQMLNMMNGLAKDYIANPQYKRTMYVNDVVNYAGMFLGNVLGLDKF